MTALNGSFTLNNQIHRFDMTNYIFYGLVTSAVSFGYTLILYFMGYHGEKMEEGQLLGYLGLVIMIVGMVLSVREAKKDSFEESMDFTYGKVFKAGFITVIFIGLGSAIFGYIYATYINPEMSDYVIQMQQDKMIEQGSPAEVLEQVERMTRVMLQPHIQALIAFVSSLFLGLFFSLILGIFMRGNVPEIKLKSGEV